MIPGVTNAELALRRLRFHRAVDTLDEGEGGGVSVVLKRGWSFLPDVDRRESRFSTPVRILAAVEEAVRFFGPFAD